MFACGSDSSDSTECGLGTILVDGTCVLENEIECGTGTVLQDGSCVPENILECGEGTVLQDGLCVPAETITCGQGTVLQDGICVPEGSSQLDCGPGTIVVEDQCVAADLQYVHLPFLENETVVISQGYYGYTSHSGESRYAVDFEVPEGTIVTAARSGIVLAIYEESDTGCGNDLCADLANFVLIDHGDGTIGKYFHLQQNGALVDPGDVVCQGQQIALSGNTGFSTGPHLHFSVVNFNRSSLPLYVYEFGDLTEGVPFGGHSVTSANIEPDVCQESIDFSACLADTFLHYGIELDSATPCSLAVIDQAYDVSGRVYSDSNKLIIGTLGFSESNWSLSCVSAEADGTFQFSFNYASNRFNPGDLVYFILMAADDQCHSVQGWSTSVPIILQ
jgi:murein DD-endopeptidase MepM/ murein hydrolase activator NlpD